MKIKIDKNKCIGCGGCGSVCPDVFGMKNGKAVVKKVTKKSKCAKNAAEICPVQAISIF